MLTRKQKELLLMIRSRILKDGVTPSFDEMKEALGLKSKSGIHRLITGLEERGFIKRLPHRARALEIVRLPDSLEDRPVAKKARGGEGGVIQIPLYGRIAAGTPIEAIADPQNMIDIPPDFLSSAKGGGGAEHYALEVAGDSMIEAGILDGDHVLIRRADTADNGAIVVALVDGHEATLKTLERRKDGIALVPANAAYETRVLEPARVKVQGRLVGLVRRY